MDHENNAGPSNQELCDSDEGFSKNHQGVLIHRRQKLMIYNLYLQYRNEGGNKSENVKATAKALGVSERFVWSSIAEKEATGMLASPTKTRKRKRCFDKLDERQQSILRRIVHRFFLASEIPTLDKILVEVQSNEELPPMQRTTLWKTLEAMGFNWNSRTRKPMLSENPEIAKWRMRYLDSIRKFRLEGKKIYYLDETWVNAGHTKGKVWTDKTVTSASEAFNRGLSTGLKNPSGKGKRLIILHIGNEEGFVENGLLSFESKKTGDYHEEMNANVFENWMKRTLPLLEPNCVIVMDNAPYHSRKAERNPTMRWTKDMIINWLNEKGIPFEARLAKLLLFDIAKQHFERKPTVYVIDELVKSTGRQILRLPPYHCQFNPIELIWAQVKGYVAANNKTFKFADMKILFQDDLKTITPEKWARCVEHAIKEEDITFPVDHIIDAMEVEFIVNTGDSDDDIYSDE